MRLRSRNNPRSGGKRTQCPSALVGYESPSYPAILAIVMQKIEPINEKEEAWIKTQLEGASKFVEGFSLTDGGQPLSLGALDRAFCSWLTSGPWDTNVVNAIVNHVGIAFGQALVDGIGLKWVIATDHQGSDLAVYGLPDRGGVLVYPANFVAKRWERREANFLEEAYRQIAHDTGAVCQKWQQS